jgi:hypothetical protein
MSKSRVQVDVEVKSQIRTELKSEPQLITGSQSSNLTQIPNPKIQMQNEEKYKPDLVQESWSKSKIKIVVNVRIRVEVNVKVRVWVKGEVEVWVEIKVEVQSTSESNSAYKPFFYILSKLDRLKKSNSILVLG